MPSSVIRYFRYDVVKRRLLVVFQSGRRYAYLDVPPAIASAMERAFSKGEYFNAHIRDRFAYERLDDAQ
jgi:lysyl-tRNA synthetase class 2